MCVECVSVVCVCEGMSCVRTHNKRVGLHVCVCAFVKRWKASRERGTGCLCRLRAGPKKNAGVYLLACHALKVTC